MKISLKWLEQYLDISDLNKSPELIGQKLTAAGLEVEGISDLSTALKNVVVAKIIELGRHPNADRLTVCQVDCGEGKTRQIVCGAKNHKQGDFVVAALPGAVLPGNFLIKESKIRDVESKGMLCSEVELGLKAESDGILILPSSAPVGRPFAEYFGLDDVIFEINVTPNRSDCLSHLGLARELACLFDRKVKTPSLSFKAGNISTKKNVSLELKASDLCPRYAGRLVKGVKVGPSPDWLKQRLKAIDVNSINNVVDITNLVMFEFGQPLHAFDLKSLEGSKVSIERAKAGEKFISFDGTELTLSGDELTIRDQNKAVALAGIVGGKNSGVSDSTTDLFIESAHFAADTVRKTMRRWNIQTDSAYRFSRGTNVEAVVSALDRATSLILELAGGEAAADYYDEYPKPILRTPIRVTAEYVSQRLGYIVKVEELQFVLEKLGCTVKGKVELEVLPPTYRNDLSDKTDLVEEIGRLKGYDLIPENFPALVRAPLVHDSSYLSHQRVADILVRQGFSQAINYGFISAQFQGEFLGGPQVFADSGYALPWPPVRLQNPMSEDLNAMRVSLLPGLFKNLLHNVRYGNDLGRLFELGFVFEKKEADYAQSPRLALAAWGQKIGLWSKTGDRPVIFDLKSTVEGLLKELGITSFQWQNLSSVAPFFHPAQAAQLIIEGRAVGWLGTLHPEMAEKEKLALSVALFELDLDKLLRGQPRLPKAQSISRHPVLVKDIALVMPEEMPVSEVIKEIKKQGGEALKAVEVFDVFRGGNLQPDKKSVAFQMRFEYLEGAPADTSDANLTLKIAHAVSEKLKLQLR